MTKIIKFFKVTGIVLCSIIIITFLFVLINSQLGNSTIRADIDGLGTKLISIRYRHFDRTDEQSMKFAFSLNGKINVKIPLQKTGFVWIELPIDKITRKVYFSKDIMFYLDPNSEFVIKGKSTGLSLDYDIVKGNTLSFQRNELRKALLPYRERESFLLNESRIMRKTNPEESSRIFEQFNSLTTQVFSQQIEWAKKHLDYEITPDLFSDSRVPRDTVIKYYNLLSENAKEFEFGQQLGRRISGWINTLVGNLAPNFEQYTNLNEPFELAELKGKYVVLDFWGTWCPPCIAGLPKMKEYYEKYRDKLEIVGIACYDTKENWEKVIKENQLHWINVLNDKTINDISILYGISLYPTKFIIDKEGKIIQSFQGEGDDFYDKIDEIMQQ